MNPNTASRPVSTTFRLVCTVAALALPGLTFAGGHAQVLLSGEDKTGHMSIEYDGDKARMQTEEKPHSYFIVRDAHAYAVSSQDGETQVFDLNQVAEIMQSRSGGGGIGARRAGGFGGGMGGRFGGGAGGGRQRVNLDVAEIKSLKDTGKSETVAGIAGNVYTLEYLDSEGTTKTAESVLTKDSRAREFSKAMYAMGQTLKAEMGTGEGQSKVAGGAALWKQIDSEGLGLLRFGEHLKLTQIDSDSPSGTRFELPAAVTPIEGIRDLRQLRVLRED